MTYQPHATQIHLITVVGEYSGILPHMLAHYQSLGVEDLLIHAHVRSHEDPTLTDITRIAKDFSATIASTLIKPWRSSDNTLLYTIPRSQFPNNWFILADQDELQVYPEDLTDVIRYCDRKGYDYIEGCLIDRLSATGTLDQPLPDNPLWDQFPMGSILSARVLGAVTNKIVAAKGHVTVGHGQHHAYAGRGCPVSEFYIPVHHFKWVADLQPRLQARAESLPHGLYIQECSRFLAYYSEAGRIDLDDPTLLAARCDPEYPHWNTVREWRAMAPNFSAELAMARKPPEPAGGRRLIPQQCNSFSVQSAQMATSYLCSP